MRKALTLDEAFEQIKEKGEKERDTIECAERVSAIIEKIVKARIESGMTQRQLAEKCGMKQAAIARIESLQVMPRIDTLVRIANSLDMTIDVAENQDPTYIVSFNGRSYTNNSQFIDILKYHTENNALSFACVTA